MLLVITTMTIENALICSLFKILTFFFVLFIIRFIFDSHKTNCAAYGYRNSYVSPTRGWLHSWDAGPSRSDRLIYTRRDTQVRPYTQLVKVEREQNDPLETISETLGALNTVGNYIVNMTRGVEITDPPKELPSALYTIFFSRPQRDGQHSAFSARCCVASTETNDRVLHTGAVGPAEATCGGTRK